VQALYLPWPSVLKLVGPFLPGETASWQERYEDGQ
jgi:hypothetical protein